MDKEKVTLSRQELKTCVVMQRLVQKQITIQEAAELLKRSTRQVLRIKARYLKEGDTGVIHKNRGRRPAHSLNDELKKEVVRYYQSSIYGGSNDHHFTELLKEREEINISRSSVRRILRSSGIPPARKRRSPKIYRPRKRKDQRGMLIQMDASFHPWLEDRSGSFALVAGIDDATGEVVGAVFRPTEDLAGYLYVMEQMVEQYGIPASVYTDQHTIFRSPNEKLTVEEELEGKEVPLSQFGQALVDLGVAHWKATTPQAKGRIERLWETLQDRLVVELRLRKIQTLEEANQVLPHLVARHNISFSKEPADSQSAFVPYSYSIPLSHILCYREGNRKVSARQTVSIQNRTYQILEGQVPRTTVEIRRTLSGERYVVYNHQFFRLKECEEYLPQAPILPPKEKADSLIQRKPAPNHPWRAWVRTKKNTSSPV
jgi:transposase